MARATYTPNAPLLLTNIQYNLTIVIILYATCSNYDVGMGVKDVSERNEAYLIKR